MTTFDLVGHACATLPYEHTHPIRRLAVSPDGRLLLSVDSQGWVRACVHLDGLGIGSTPIFSQRRPQPPPILRSNPPNP